MIENELKKHIRKLIGVLVDEDELSQILKARLTKREYKMLYAWSENKLTDDVKDTLNMDDEEYTKVSTKLIKKLNQERIKQELVGIKQQKC